MGEWVGYIRRFGCDFFNHSNNYHIPPVRLHTLYFGVCSQSVYECVLLVSYSRMCMLCMCSLHDNPARGRLTPYNYLAAALINPYISTPSTSHFLNMQYFLGQNMCVEGGSYLPLKPLSIFCPRSCGCRAGDLHCPHSCPARIASDVCSDHQKAPLVPPIMKGAFTDVQGWEERDPLCPMQAQRT
jgi:hypothetical protein